MVITGDIHEQSAIASVYYCINIISKYKLFMKTLNFIFIICLL